MNTRQLLKALRDRTPVGSTLVSVAGLARRCGVEIPERLEKHLHFTGVFDVRVPEHGMFHMRSRGHVIENKLYWRGLYGHEGECLRPWVKLAAESRVTLDIGANTGFFSLVAATVRPDASVHAFEPLPRIAAIVRENLALNPGMKVQVHELAVGSEDGVAQIHDPGGDQPSSASLLDSFLTTETTAISVQVRSIDSFIAELGLPTVDLIKLDVEGFEEHALRGMSSTLARFKPSMLIEMLDDREPLMIELERLRQMGYDVYMMDDAGLSLCSGTIVPPRNRNILLVHPERRSAIETMIARAAAH